MQEQMTWSDINEVETQIYEAKALLSVMQDAVNNQVCTPTAEALSATIGVVENKLRVLEDYVPKLFSLYKETKKTPSKWDADGEVGIPMEDSAGEEDGGWLDEEDEEDGETEDAGRPTRSDFLTGKSLRVELKEEHPNGSATYTIHSDDDTLQRVFEAFFVQALLRGVESAEEENKKFISLKRAAEELERFLRVWEDCGDLDYDPSVKEKREALTEALYGKA